MNTFIHELLVTDKNFNEQTYLASNPDVAQAVREGKIKSGWAHFNTFGRYEGRKIRKYVAPETPICLDRDLIALSYLTGTGIEIGALHAPLLVSQSAHVKYVDRLSSDDLQKQYPELQAFDLVHPDIIDDGERLATIQDATQDFVIANHFLEHCQNPILAVENMFRVLKSGGFLYLAIPDKRYTFDIDRPPTPLEHLIKDYENGPDWSRQEHFEEWVNVVEKITGAIEVQKRVHTLIAMNYSIHFHVWTQVEMLKLMIYLKGRIDFEIEVMLYNRQIMNEMIWVLCKG